MTASAPATLATGKWALVAGASTKVGRAVALRLSEHFDIVALDESGTDLSSLVREIGDRARVIKLVVDMAQPSELEPMLKELFKREGFEVELLICCVNDSSNTPADLFGDIDVDRLLRRGFATPVELTRLLSSKRLNSRALCQAVFVADADSIGAGALEGFTRAAATELAPKARVNCVKFAGAGTAAQAATTVQFLVSDDARWVTGQLVQLGGQT